MFNECNDKCILCANYNHCLAGHNDDDFILADESKLVERLAEQLKLCSTLDKENVSDMYKFKKIKDNYKLLMDTIEKNYLVETTK